MAKGSSTSKIDITALEKELRQGRIAPVYLVVGAESYIMGEALRLIAEAISALGGDTSSTISLRGKEAVAERTVTALRTVPLFGGRPLVMIREADKLSRDFMEALVPYLEAPITSATLVIAGEKLDGRTKFAQVAQKSGVTVECKPLFDDKVPLWINSEVRRRGKNISQDGARFLADMVGKELSLLAQAIERIALYVGNRQMIEMKDVEHCISETNQHTIFELTDAVGKRSLPKTLSLLRNILDSGESAILILNMLVRHFRILAKAKEIAGRLSDRSEIAKYLGVHPFFATNYLDQARNFSASEIRSYFRTFHRCDRELKSSRIPAIRILERGLFSIKKGQGSSS